MRRVLFFVLALLLSARLGVAGQGVQSGTLTGAVTSSDGLSLPGATVTVSSPSLQGTRMVVTDVNGVYAMHGLPPGQYTITIEMDGLTTAERRVTIELGGTSTVDLTLAVAPVRETVTVTAPAPSPLATTQTGANFRMADVARLPVGRTPFLMAELAPGLTDNTPNSSQVTISGAFAYDNVFLINGVDVNDNVLGTANNLFIEEAIDEAQVLTSGVPAEFGRFSGGVVNLITKSGGNTVAGSYRTTLTNPTWTVETPLEKSRGAERASKLSSYHEATLGGPILRDRLWFFGAGRLEDTTIEGLFAQTNIPFTRTQKNRRVEVKLTGRLRDAQTLQGSVVDNRTNLHEPSLPFSIDPATFGDPSTPNRLFVTSYSGVIAGRFFATGQFSEKAFGVRGVGGTSTDLHDSPFLTRGVLGVPAQLHYNAKYFDATDPEDRDNHQFAGSVSTLLARRGFGSHDLKAGGERFVSTRVGGNSNTSTGYVFQTDYALGANGRPLVDANGRLVPRFVPGVSRVQLWMPARGARIDIATTAAYLSDRWTAGPRWTFDLGVRYEHVTSEATDVANGISADTIVPRLGATFDLTGDGKTVAQATYAHYAGKYSDVQFARNTNVGNADRVTFGYTGPAGQGREFEAGFNPANYTTTIGGVFPRANVFFDEDLSAPITRELTVGAGRALGTRGFARVTYTLRRGTHFIEDFVTIDGGTTNVTRNGVNFGTFDNVVYRNSDEPKRAYQGIQAQANYRLRSNWSLAGHWTVQLQNDGTFEGEGANTPAVQSAIGDYPEIFALDRSNPDGRLNDFQRHKVRVWSIYTLGLGRFGTVDVAPLYRFNSGLTYSLVAGGVPITAIQAARNPGYVRPGSGSQAVFFGARGAQFFEGYHLLDLGLTYAVPVWRSARPWVRLEVLNAFNNQKLISWDTTVTPNGAGRSDANGLPLEYIRGARFGQATRNADYPRPRPGLDGGRTFQAAFGVRF